MKKIKNLLQIIMPLLLVCITSCTPQGSEPVPCNGTFTTIYTPTISVWQGTETTVSYGADASQIMDIHLPTNRNNNTKVFVTIHGGGWSATGGNKEKMDKYIISLKERFSDAAFYNINYRLYTNGTNKFPTQETDVVSAINFIVNRSAVDNVSNKIILVGESAGAHLALLYGFKHNTAQHIKAMAVFAAPSNLKTINSINGLSVLANLSGGDTTLIASQNPINYITNLAPPTIFFHGTSDELVDYNQSVNLNTVLQQNNVTHFYQQIGCENHDFSNSYNTCCNLIQQFVNINIP